jgi:hypothetical protein
MSVDDNRKRKRIRLEEDSQLTDILTSLHRSMIKFDHKLDQILNSDILLNKISLMIEQSFSSTEQQIRRHQFAIERLEKQINDLQIHALHGELGQ